MSLRRIIQASIERQACQNWISSESTDSKLSTLCSLSESGMSSISSVMSADEVLNADEYSTMAADPNCLRFDNLPVKDEVLAEIVEAVIFSGCVDAQHPTARCFCGLYSTWLCSVRLKLPMFATTWKIPCNSSHSRNRSRVARRRLLLEGR